MAVNPLDPPRRCYRVEYVNGKIVYVFAQYHDATIVGILTLFDRDETVNPNKFRFHLIIPTLRLEDVREVDPLSVPSDASTLGKKPFLGPTRNRGNS